MAAKSTIHAIVYRKKQVDCEYFVNFSDFHSGVNFAFDIKISSQSGLDISMVCLGRILLLSAFLFLAHGIFNGGSYDYHQRRNDEAVEIGGTESLWASLAMAARASPQADPASTQNVRS